eukprot:TRINITY_DN5821_c0_g1_i1.p1 TRINITY_DN5821_c0_g1~~TRINITY_DN5821_c0_g1_i1.p1  ORF type:complete len:435 (-),score=81.99 TRINITY_DN5821_c0_g1_i1:152-1456(-)
MQKATGVHLKVEAHPSTREALRLSRDISPPKPRPGLQVENRFPPNVVDPFLGQNAAFEIETLDEFLKKGGDAEDPSTVKLNGYVFQGVDLSSISNERWAAFDISGAIFFGGEFPEGVTLSSLKRRGATVWAEPSDIPFKAFRPFMYNQIEVMTNDKLINSHYMSHYDISTRLAQSIHDFSMVDALHDYLEGKTVVGVMGGHRTARNSPEYQTMVKIARDVVKAGFVVATGGGAGTMEAANLGAYLADKTDEQVEQALAIMAADNEGFEGVEWLNPAPAEKVIALLGEVSNMPSLGVPTFRYAQEPPNRFASWHAKFFQNSIREDGLLSICRGGILYSHGGPGTRQEIFQAACHNSEISDDSETRPMVFVGKDYWRSTGILDVLENTSSHLPFFSLILESDDQVEIVDHLVAHAKQKNYRLNDDLSVYTEKYWER